MTSAAHHELKRSLGFWALTSYGLGDILGAGIYALMGKVAGAAGTHAWLSFLVSLLAAGLTAFTYAELVTRFPKSGAESFYCQQGFGSPLVAVVVGWLVFCAGVLSLSTIAVVFSGYARAWLPHLPSEVLIVTFVCALGLLNFRGIRESSAANIACTMIEAGGILLVVFAGAAYVWGGDASPATTPSESTAPDWSGIMTGAGLAFFAFIGFEDMANVAEEAKDPRRHFPAAILLALGAAGVLYMATAVVATQVVTPTDLAASQAPLLRVVEVAAGRKAEAVFPFIAMFAVANTGLLNFITASRLLYGMANQDLLPAGLARVHAKRRTPHVAILTVLAVVLVLALTGSVTYLAGSTSALLLVVFLAVNLALVMVHRRELQRERGVFRIPTWVPVLGVGVTLGVLVFSQLAVLKTVVVLIAMGCLLYAWRKIVRRRVDRT